MVAGEALVDSGVVVFEDGEGEGREAVLTQLIRGQPRGNADGIVVSEFHVRQVDVPVVLSFVDDHRQHLSHGVVDALNATVTVGVVGARRDFSHAEELAGPCSAISLFTWRRMSLSASLMFLASWCAASV